MSEKSVAFEYCDKMVEDFEKVIEHPVREKSSVYYTGVDLGTACVVIAVLDENKRPVAGAYRYADVVRDGMVVDYIGAVQIVRELKEQIEEELDTELIYAAGAIPPGTDLLDSGAVKNVIQGAGFECTNLLDESTAANQVLQMKNGAVVDIGGGTTDVAVISLGGVVVSESIKVAGDKFDEAIIRYVRKRYSVAIGERTAEEIKVKIGGVWGREEPRIIKVKGRCLVQGLPKEVTISSLEMPEALEEPITAVVEAVCNVIERTPPELIGDILYNGIVMTGGGSLLYGLDTLIANVTGIKTRVANKAVDCVAIGTGLSLDHLSVIPEGSLNISRQRQQNYY